MTGETFPVYLRRVAAIHACPPGSCRMAELARVHDLAFGRKIPPWRELVCLHCRTSYPIGAGPAAVDAAPVGASS